MAHLNMNADQLKRSRLGRKTAITNLMQKIAKNMLDDDQEEVESGLAQLLQKEAAVIPYIQQLEALSDPEDVEAVVAENEAILDSIIAMKVKVNRYLAQKKTIPIPAAAAKINAKLPKIQIRRFDGTIQDWERFLDQFSSSIDSNPTLSAVDKFGYLISLLSKEAEKTIQGLTLSEANYVIALDLLKEKYGRKDVLIDEHLNCLVKTAAVQMSKDGQDLRRLLEDTKIHLRALEALGTNVASLGILLCPILLRALPVRIQSEWNRKPASKNNVDLTVLLDFVKNELENVEQIFRLSCEKVNNAKNSKVTQKDGASFSKDETRKLGTASALLASQCLPSKLPYCFFCDNNTHYSNVCDVFKSNKARKSALSKARRCWNCLARNHEKWQCTYPITCFDCKQQHHTFLCPKRDVKSAGSTAASAAASPEVGTSSASGKSAETKSLIASASCHASSASKSAPTVSILQTLRVWIAHEKGTEPVVMLIDGGSERSFVTERVVKRLNLPKSQGEKLTVFSFGGNQRSQVYENVPLIVVGSNNIQLNIQALQVQDICSGVSLWESGQIENYLQSKQNRSWSQLMGSGKKESVDILIGADWYWQVMTGHMKRISPYLMATQSIFGWVLQGSTQTFNSAPTMVSMFAVTEDSTMEELNRRISSCWELDNNGTLALENKSQLLLEDVEVLENFNKTTTFSGNRYQVEIPWNSRKPELCNNFNLSKQRLRSLILKLRKQPDLFKSYQAGIYEYLENNHTEEVTSELEDHGPIYYMPHQPVIKEERKTTKLRIVFDASSHANHCLSLNQCQYAGPNLNPLILDLILRFRSHKVAISADVEKAFLQIQLKPEERNATRFLWTDEEWTEDSEPKLKIFRMTRVLFGMKSSPFLLAAAIRFHTSTHPDSTPALHHVIDSSTYVDDVLTGSSSVQKTFILSKELRVLMAKGGMNLRKWATNDAELRKLWLSDKIIAEEEPIELLKVLGLIWNPFTDKLSIKSSDILQASEKCKHSKRGLLELLARIFDPLGFVTPFSIIAKILLQDVWRLKLGWDEEVPVDLSKKLEQWKNDLGNLSLISVPRWYGTIDFHEPSCQLHLFCDASPRAYGVVAYLRLVKEDSEIESRFITSKSRVAPLTLMSIPRLELMACLVGARLAQHIHQAWENPKMEIFLWTDSKVALEWIKGTPSSWKVFVGRRVQEIQTLSAEATWKYCQSKHNVADIITRGQSLEKLVENQEWWYGPSWLRKDLKVWPSEVASLDLNSEVQVQEEKDAKTVTLVTKTHKPILNVTDFSSWWKLVRITAWVCRFLKNCWKMEVIKQNYLSAKELQEAEAYWLGVIQKDCFPEELKALQEKSPISQKSSILRFNPFLDEAGLVRIGGRLKFAQLNEDQKHPIILQYSSATELFILDHHLRTMHGGVQTTLISLRQKVWILRGRQSVQKALRKCMKCKKWEAKPALVIEAPLPAARISESEPFLATGLDFAGPCWISQDSERRKSYICLFTCAVTRAIHLELVSSQGTKPFLLAFRRFLARRGTCKIIFSDNAKAFHQTDNLLKQAWENLTHASIQDLVAKEGIEWKFIVPKAAWWGGFYERMVGSVKRHLRRSLDSTLLGFEELLTILTEVEAVVNSRPLVTMSEDPEDKEYITPAHFLIGRSARSLTDVFPDITAVPSKDSIRKRWNFRKRLMDGFWKRWSEDYLLQLQSAHQLNVPKEQCTVKVNDVVLLRDNKRPRGQWKMARVDELTEGRDGHVRSVMLQTINGNFIRRAVQQICPLEIV